MGDFTARLHQDCPPLARIDASKRSRLPGALPEDFTIRHSAGGAMDTQIVPDAATCPACLAEMRDPRERRYRYPFINCTHCGPRFTIIRAMPYDRPATSMAHFRSACRVKRSIAIPPIGVFTPSRSPARTAGQRWNGVRATQPREAGAERGGGDAEKRRHCRGQRAGRFHLSATRKSAGGGDASGTQTAPDKAAGGDDPACGWPAGAGQALLRSPAPIVLTPKAWLPDSRGDRAGLDCVGIMLPANPLQHLLMMDCQRPLVMTSGNLSGRPPAIQPAGAGRARGYCGRFSAAQPRHPAADG
jgi:hydrogenase maturation protein HypF